MRCDDATFVDRWSKASTLAAAARALRTTRRAATLRASRLRVAGIRLKYFRRTSRLDVARLNRIARSA